jgi:hypothetical protein
MKLSTQIAELQSSNLVFHPNTTRIDSIIWIKLEMLKQTAIALEKALQRKTPSKIKTPPIFLTKPTPINPQWLNNMVIFGD